MNHVSARVAALLTVITLAALPAFAERLYTLTYNVTQSKGRFTFDVTVTHEASGQTILKSKLRTLPREWGELETGHAGRTVKLRVLGEANGYAELVLDVRERGHSVQHELFKYTARAAAPPTKWRGERITLHLRDADLVDVVLALAKITGANIAIDPGISGSVTIDLVDVPSDQALDLILKQHGLAAQVQSGVTFVRK